MKIGFYHQDRSKMIFKKWTVSFTKSHAKPIDFHNVKTGGWTKKFVAAVRKVSSTTFTNKTQAEIGNKYLMGSTLNQLLIADNEAVTADVFELVTINQMR